MKKWLVHILSLMMLCAASSPVNAGGDGTTGFSGLTGAESAKRCALAIRVSASVYNMAISNGTSKRDAKAIGQRVLYKWALRDFHHNTGDLISKHQQNMKSVRETCRLQISKLKLSKALGMAAEMIVDAAP